MHDRRKARPLTGGFFLARKRDDPRSTAQANRRLADEYDAAQERGEVRSDRQRTASQPEAEGNNLVGHWSPP
jgi:hypothetical protein